MTTFFRAPGDLLDQVRHDLERPHGFAAERVGFFLCRAGHLAQNGLVILAAGYAAVDDADYIEDYSVGALMGPAAIRKALQLAYNRGLADISIFHVHMHDHHGPTGFSPVDDSESRRFVPDFFNVAPAMPHGTIVLSRDQAFGMCWRKRGQEPELIDRFASVGAPLRMWGIGR